jgi:hypothetical protein
MTKHECELAASILGFVGGGILSLDALFAVRQARSQRGREALQQSVEKARVELEKAKPSAENPARTAQSAPGVYMDDNHRVLTSAYAMQILDARRTALTGRFGFGFMTLGFFFDLLSKLKG